MLRVNYNKQLQQPVTSRVSIFLQVVGGVAMSASYYQHVLATEGRTEQVPACQLLITRRHLHELLLLPATQVNKLLLDA